MATATEPHLGKFRYLTRGSQPTPSKEAYLLPSLSEFGDVVTLPLTDLRPSLDLAQDSPYKLDVHGFTARRHSSALHSAPYNRSSWNNEKLLRQVYFPEVEDFVKNLTGCKKAVVSAAVVRNRLYSEGDESTSAEPEVTAEPSQADDTFQQFPPIFGNTVKDGVCPAPKVHLDCTPKGARHHIRRYHSEVTSAAEKVIEAENRLLESGVQWNDLKDHYQGGENGSVKVPRFALFSIWRPLKTVHRDPLALSSAASFPVSDYVPTDQREPTDHNIPAHLYRIIDPDAVNITNKNEVNDSNNDDTYQTQSYLAYAPRDREKTSHDWHYISEQQPSDVLVIQLFDNEMEAHARAPLEDGKGQSDLGVGGAVHSAFELVDQDENAEARESIEVRVAAFW
ncbi:ga4 desaturase [Fusarium sporotrichioides]|uniref:Ga4 desaturase n=1 Tax=Fusarium sporotrichioides TaxID=5514 RepID=A0A395RV68_FUSSP|nr:ga4 desaturase [Fusarium sporotrichioides]